MLKVFMIDDEVDLCTVVKENLEATGQFTVVGHNKPETAEEAVKRESPDVILLDIVMPGRSGIDVMNGLKRDPLTKKIPVIVVSGKGEMVFNKRKNEFQWIPHSKIVQSRGDLPSVKGADALAGAYGAAEYVSKPFSTELLIQVIQDVMARYRKSGASSENVDNS